MGHSTLLLPVHSTLLLPVHSMSLRLGHSTLLARSTDQDSMSSFA